MYGVVCNELPGGVECAVGQCKTCDDSDGGIDIWVQGTVYTSPDETQIIDSCDGDVLTEYYCESTNRSSTTESCKWGCAVGACQKKSKGGGGKPGGKGKNK